MKNKKYTKDDLLKRIENLEKVIYNIERSRLTETAYPFPNQPHHFHNGLICYQNPCVWG